MLSYLKFELWRFIRWHWPHFLLAIPGAVFWTVLHEGAHALAVVLQGGQIMKFVWLPAAARWGYVEYNFPDKQFSELAIAVAPYCFWLVLMFTTGLLSLRAKPYTPWAASTIFIWMYAAPLGDIAMPAIPYLFGSTNDFMYAFGYPTRSISAFVGLFGIAAVAFGMIVQQRLYRERALSGIAYTVMAVAGLVVIGVLDLVKSYIS